MISMGVAQDHVVDRGQRRRGGLYERQHAIVRSAGEVVIRAGVVDECEVRAAHEDRQARSDINDIDGEGWSRGAAARPAGLPWG